MQPHHSQAWTQAACTRCSASNPHTRDVSAFDTAHKACALRYPIATRRSQLARHMPCTAVLQNHHGRASTYASQHRAFNACSCCKPENICHPNCKVLMVAWKLSVCLLEAPASNKQTATAPSRLDASGHQQLLQLPTGCLCCCVISTANKLATNEHTRYRAGACDLVESVLDVNDVVASWEVIKLQVAGNSRHSRVGMHEYWRKVGQSAAVNIS